MTVLYIDYTAPNNQFFNNLSDNPIFRLDSQNYINSLGRNNMNTLGNVSLLDIFLSRGKYVEPHFHQNAAELVYCISGSAIVSFINPFTNELSNIPITPGQVANVPQGWWHYEVATSDQTHLLAIFDAPYPQVILGSDIMRLTPANVMADAYCLDEQKWQAAIAPIDKSVYIGPPDDCQQNSRFNRMQQHAYGSGQLANGYEQAPYQGYYEGQLEKGSLSNQQLTNIHPQNRHHGGQC